MTDFFAPISGFLILFIAGLVAYTVRRLVPVAVIVGIIVVVAAVAAVQLELFESFTPLLVIYINGALLGGLGGFLYAKHGKREQGGD